MFEITTLMMKNVFFQTACYGTVTSFSKINKALFTMIFPRRHLNILDKKTTMFYLMLRYMSALLDHES